MKSKMTIFIVTLFLSVCYLSGNAQTSMPKGKAQLIEFTNATAKFTVTAGKTWHINNAFSFFGRNPIYWIFIKSINGTILTDYSKKVYGPILYHSDVLYPNTSLVFPENTTFELIILVGERNEQVLCEKKAYINFIETDN
jgi:hypothetical protein